VAGTSGVSLTGGLTVQQGGVSVTGGLSILSSGLVITSGGVSVAAGGARVTAGGLTVSSGGLQVTGGGSVLSGGLAVSGSASVLSGGVYIGTGGFTVSTQGIMVTGGLTIASAALVVQAGLTVAGHLNLQYIPYVFSDRRLKTQIEPLQDALGRLAQLRGVYYRWKSMAALELEVVRGAFDVNSGKSSAEAIEGAENVGQENGVRFVGVLAQDVQRVLPELIDVHPLRSSPRLNAAHAASTAQKHRRRQTRYRDGASSSDTDAGSDPPLSEQQDEEDAEVVEKTQEYLAVRYAELVPVLIEGVRELHQAQQQRLARLLKLQSSLSSLSSPPPPPNHLQQQQSQQHPLQDKAVDVDVEATTVRDHPPRQKPRRSNLSDDAPSKQQHLGVSAASSTASSTSSSDKTGAAELSHHTTRPKGVVASSWWRNNSVVQRAAHFLRSRFSSLWKSSHPLVTFLRDSARRFLSTRPDTLPQSPDANIPRGEETQEAVSPLMCRRRRNTMVQELRVAVARLGQELEDLRSDALQTLRRGQIAPSGTHGEAS
jgi:hypothetical protein